MAMEYHPCPAQPPGLTGRSEVWRICDRAGSPQLANQGVQHCEGPKPDAESATLRGCGGGGGLIARMKPRGTLKNRGETGPRFPPVARDGGGLHAGRTKQPGLDA